jgi:hypothetical protein
MVGCGLSQDIRWGGGQMNELETWRSNKWWYLSIELEGLEIA